MGEVSTSEDNEERKIDAEFCQGEASPELKALLSAPVEPRVFGRRSAPAPQLRKSKAQLRAESRYREREYSRAVARASEAQLRREIALLKAENEELKALLKMRVTILQRRTKKR